MPAKPISSIAAIAAFTLSVQTQAIAGVVISGDYYEQTTAYQTCLDAFECRLNLAPIPVDKFLMIEHFNCTVQSQEPIYFFSMGSSATAGGSSARVIQYPFETNTMLTDYHLYFIDREIKYKIGASPYVYFSAKSVSPGNKVLYCTITGTLSPR